VHRKQEVERQGGIDIEMYWEKKKDVFGEEKGCIGERE
jgi:hypothetical protein